MHLLPPARGLSPTNSASCPARPAYGLAPSAGAARLAFASPADAFAGPWQRKAKKQQQVHFLASANEGKKDASKDAKGAKKADEDKPKDQPQAPLSPSAAFKIGLFSGAVAGLLVDIVLFPLDTLKTRLQASAGQRLTRDLFKGIYNGIVPAAAASAPAAAMFFGTYDLMKRALVDGRLRVEALRDERRAPLVHMLAAVCADITGSAVRVPFEIVKQRLQAGLHARTWDAVRAIAQTEGLPGFFKGYTSLVIRELPFDLIQFPLYEYLKKQYRRKFNDDHELQTWQTMLCGSIAGGISAGLTTPFDTVKTRIMLQNSTKAVAATAGRVPYKGVMDAFTRIAKEEGPKALFSGFVPRVMWISLGGAIFFGGYETASKFLRPKIEARERAAATPPVPVKQK